MTDGQRQNDPIYNSAGVATDFAVDVDLIVTRTAQMVDETEVSVDAGSLETFKGRATFGHTFQSGVALLLTGTLFDSAGKERLFPAVFDLIG